MLPKEELYMPPMNIRVRDHRQFGRKPLVGNHCLKSMEKFRVEPRIQEIVEEAEGGKHSQSDLELFSTKNMNSYREFICCSALALILCRAFFSVFCVSPRFIAPIPTSLLSHKIVYMGEN
jgi:hypothetical protein